MNQKIEIFYTGSGITIAETDIEKNQYAVVSSEAPEYLTIYSDCNEKDYLPENMVGSFSVDEIPQKYKVLYAKMLEELKAV